MAALTPQQLSDVLRDWMRENLDTVGITKADLSAAVAALNTFLENNAAAINNAFPQPARSSLSVGQKAMVVAYVALKRFRG